MVTVEAQALEFEYSGGVRAVRGLDFNAEPGELVCVLGPNGSGKSTLLKLLAHLLPPARGTVRLDGRSVARMSTRERAKSIALVPQTLSAIPSVVVRDFVLGGRYGHLDRWRRSTRQDALVTLRSLEAADVGDVAERFLTELSGGQLQRVLVARALAQEAGVLLVDEPTNSLDPGHQLAVFGLIARQTCEGHATVVVTHDLNLASQFATRIVLMNEGRICARGDVDAVLRREILEPVYGPGLRFDRWPCAGGSGERPVVLPWRDAVAPDREGDRA